MNTLHKTVLGALLASALIVPASARQPAKLKGTVVDAAGQPVAGAMVEGFVHDISTRSGGADFELKEQTQADANGAFELPALPDGAVLIARKTGLAPAWKQVHRMAGSEHRLMLAPAAALTGIVVDENDRPVADAEVAVAVSVCVTEMEGGGSSFGYITGGMARDLFNARTGADGKFRIGGFPTNGSAGLTAKVPGKALRQSGDENWNLDSLPCRVGEEIRLVVEPAGRVEGQIFVEGGVSPVPTARLFLQPDGPTRLARSSVEPAMSDTDGRFQITSVPEGNYQLRATFGTNSPADWVAETVPVSVAAGQSTTGVKISAGRGGLIEAMVRGKQDGKPQAQVGVTARKNDYQARSLTDSNGLARLRLPAGDYHLQTSLPGSIPMVSVETGRTNRVEIELAGPQTITGVVRRPDGQPAAGLPVRIVGAFGRSEGDVETDADGRFELDSPQRYGSSDATWCILIRDAERNLAVAQDLEEDTGPLDLRLEPGMTVVGRVICEGRVLTNASAALVFWTGNSGMHLRGMSVSEAPGQFKISALPPGRRYGVYVSAPGYGQKYVSSVEPGEDSKHVEVEPVELKPANLKLAGKVVDEDDKPVAGASVNLSGDGQPNGNTRTDREGRFRFDQVCEGAVRLSANSQSFHGSVSVEGGDTNVVLKLGESYGVSDRATPRKLQGVVTGPDGRPVSGAQVAVFPQSDSRSTKTSANGAFNVSWSIQPWQMQSGGDFLLVVRDPVKDLAGAEPIPEEGTNLNVQLQPAQTLKGRVSAASGQPIAGAQVGVWLRAGNTYGDVIQQPAQAGADGAFSIKGLPAGQAYIVHAKASGYGRSQQNVEPGGESNPFELSPFTLKLADQNLVGQVVDENDKPVSGANVNLSGEDQPEGYVNTDKNGRFKFKVCEGRIQLFASSPNGGQANVTAEAGDTNVVIQLTRSSSDFRPTPKRLALKGRPLPDLTPLGLTADTAPAGRPVLLCLLDAEQRPSRRAARLLSEQSAALKQRGVPVVLVQAVAASAGALQSWTNAAPLPFPLGCVAEKSAGTKWVTEVSSLPWLILRDADGKVAAEGFALDELDARLASLKK